MKNSDWRPTASVEILQARARMYAQIRAFFASRNILEVETPIISLAENSDPNIHCFSVDTESGRRFLHSSPEYAMKRLLAAGSGDIFQITKVFRKGEVGRFHNPEFALLEWYRVDWHYWQLMDEVDVLLWNLLNKSSAKQDSLRLSYRQVFQQFADIDPFGDTLGDLTACARKFGLSLKHPPRRDECLDFLMSQVVSRAFPTNRLTYVFDYPSSQAALAAIRKGIPPIAERFEVFWGNLELANGYQELTDAKEQRERFAHEQQQRERQGISEIASDNRLISALNDGLARCSGVALGLDRLMILMTSASHIREVLAFPWDRA